MLQVLRNLTDGVDGFLLAHRYLIMDAIRSSPRNSVTVSRAPESSRFACLDAVRT